MLFHLVICLPATQGSLAPFSRPVPQNKECGLAGPRVFSRAKAPSSALPDREEAPSPLLCRRVLESSSDGTELISSSGRDSPLSEEERGACCRSFPHSGQRAGERLLSGVSTRGGEERPDTFLCPSCQLVQSLLLSSPSSFSFPVFLSLDVSALLFQELSASASTSSSSSSVPFTAPTQLSSRLRHSQHSCSLNPSSCPSPPPSSSASRVPLPSSLLPRREPSSCFSPRRFPGVHTAWNVVLPWRFSGSLPPPLGTGKGSLVAFSSLYSVCILGIPVSFSFSSFLRLLSDHHAADIAAAHLFTFCLNSAVDRPFSGSLSPTGPAGSAARWGCSSPSLRSSSSSPSCPFSRPANSSLCTSQVAASSPFSWQHGGHSSSSASPPTCLPPSCPSPPSSNDVPGVSGAFSASSFSSTAVEERKNAGQNNTPAGVPLSPGVAGRGASRVSPPLPREGTETHGEGVHVEGHDVAGCRERGEGEGGRSGSGRPRHSRITTHGAELKLPKEGGEERSSLCWPSSPLCTRQTLAVARCGGGRRQGEFFEEQEKKERPKEPFEGLLSAERGGGGGGGVFLLRGHSAKPYCLSDHAASPGDARQQKKSADQEKEEEERRQREDVHGEKERMGKETSTGKTVKSFGRTLGRRGGGESRADAKEIDEDEEQGDFSGLVSRENNDDDDLPAMGGSEVPLWCSASLLCSSRDVPAGSELPRAGSSCLVQQEEDTSIHHEETRVEGCPPNERGDPSRLGDSSLGPAPRCAPASTPFRSARSGEFEPRQRGGEEEQQQHQQERGRGKSLSTKESQGGGCDAGSCLSPPVLGGCYLGFYSAVVTFKCQREGERFLQSFRGRAFYPPSGDSSLPRNSRKYDTSAETSVQTAATGQRGSDTSCLQSVSGSEQKSRRPFLRGDSASTASIPTDLLRGVDQCCPAEGRGTAGRGRTPERDSTALEPEEQRRQPSCGGASSGRNGGHPGGGTEEQSPLISRSRQMCSAQRGAEGGNVKEEKEEKMTRHATTVKHKKKKKTTHHNAFPGPSQELMTDGNRGVDTVSKRGNGDEKTVVAEIYSFSHSQGDEDEGPVREDCGSGTDAQRVESDGRVTPRGAASASSLPSSCCSSSSCVGSSRGTCASSSVSPLPGAAASRCCCCPCASSDAGQAAPSASQRTPRKKKSRSGLFSGGRCSGSPGTTAAWLSARCYAIPLASFEYCCVEQIRGEEETKTVGGLSFNGRHDPSTQVPGAISTCNKAKKIEEDGQTHPSASFDDCPDLPWSISPPDPQRLPFSGSVGPVSSSCSETSPLSPHPHTSVSPPLASRVGPSSAVYCASSSTLLPGDSQPPDSFASSPPRVLSRDVLFCPGQADKPPRSAGASGDVEDPPPPLSDASEVLFSSSPPCPDVSTGPWTMSSSLAGALPSKATPQKTSVSFACSDHFQASSGTTSLAAASSSSSVPSGSKLAVFRQIPMCPVCLERVDDTASGIATEPAGWRARDPLLALALVRRLLSLERKLRVSRPRRGARAQLEELPRESRGNQADTCRSLLKFLSEEERETLEKKGGTLPATREAGDAGPQEESLGGDDDGDGKTIDKGTELSDCSEGAKRRQGKSEESSTDSSLFPGEGLNRSLPDSNSSSGTPTSLGSEEKDKTTSGGDTTDSSGAGGREARGRDLMETQRRFSSEHEDGTTSLLRYIPSDLLRSVAVASCRVCFTLLWVHYEAAVKALSSASQETKKGKFREQSTRKKTADRCTDSTPSTSTGTTPAEPASELRAIAEGPEDGTEERKSFSCGSLRTSSSHSTTHSLGCTRRVTGGDDREAVVEEKEEDAFSICTRADSFCCVPRSEGVRCSLSDSAGTHPARSSPLLTGEKKKDHLGEKKGVGRHQEETEKVETTDDGEEQRYDVSLTESEGTRRESSMKEKAVVGHQTPAEATSFLSRCGECPEEKDLWLCLICAYCGCGRYRGGHAKAHSDSMLHRFCLHLPSGRIWDYEDDIFVHRLPLSSLSSSSSFSSSRPPPASLSPPGTPPGVVGGPLRAAEESTGGVPVGGLEKRTMSGMTVQQNTKSFLRFGSPAGGKRRLSPLLLHGRLVSLSSCALSQHLALSRAGPSTSLKTGVSSRVPPAPPPRPPPYRGRRFSNSLTTGVQGQFRLPPRFVGSLPTSSQLPGGNPAGLSTSSLSGAGVTRAVYRSAMGLLPSAVSGGPGKSLPVESDTTSSGGSAASPHVLVSSSPGLADQVNQHQNRLSTEDGKTLWSSPPAEVLSVMQTPLPSSLSLPSYSTTGLDSPPHTREWNTVEPPLGHTPEKPLPSSSFESTGRLGCAHAFCLSQPPPGFYGSTQSYGRWAEIPRDEWLSSTARSGIVTGQGREPDSRSALTVTEAEPHAGVVRPPGVVVSSSLRQEAPPTYIFSDQSGEESSRVAFCAPILPGDRASEKGEGRKRGGSGSHPERESLSFASCTATSTECEGGRERLVDNDAQPRPPSLTFKPSGDTAGHLERLLTDCRRGSSGIVNQGANHRLGDEMTGAGLPTLPVVSIPLEPTVTELTVEGRGSFDRPTGDLRTHWRSSVLDAGDSRNAAGVFEGASPTYFSPADPRPLFYGDKGDLPAFSPVSAMRHCPDLSCSVTGRKQEEGGGETVGGVRGLVFHSEGPPQGSQHHTESGCYPPAASAVSGCPESFPSLPPPSVTSSQFLGPQRVSRNCAEDRLGRWWYLRAFFPPPLSWRKPREGRIDWGPWGSNTVYSGFKEGDKLLSNLRAAPPPSSFPPSLPPSLENSSSCYYYPPSTYVQAPSPAGAGVPARQLPHFGSTSHDLTAAAGSGEGAHGSLSGLSHHGEGGGHLVEGEDKVSESFLEGSASVEGESAPLWATECQPQSLAVVRSPPRDRGLVSRSAEEASSALLRETERGSDAAPPTSALPLEQVTGTGMEGETRAGNGKDERLARRWLPDITVTPTGDLRVSSLSPSPGLSCKREEVDGFHREARSEEKEEERENSRGQQEDAGLSFYSVGSGQYSRWPQDFLKSSATAECGRFATAGSLNPNPAPRTIPDTGADAARCPPCLPFFLEDAFLPRWSQAGEKRSSGDSQNPESLREERGTVFPSRTVEEDASSLFSSAFALGGDAEQLGGGIVVVPPVPLGSLRGESGAYEEEEQGHSDQGLFFSSVYSSDCHLEECFSVPAAEEERLLGEGGAVVPESRDDGLLYVDRATPGQESRTSAGVRRTETTDWEEVGIGSMQQTLWEQQLSSVLSSQLAYQRELYELRLRDTENAFIAEIELATATTESLNEQSVILQVQLADLACRRRDVLKRIRSAQHRIKQIREDNRFLRDLVSSMRANSKASTPPSASSFSKSCSSSDSATLVVPTSSSSPSKLPPSSEDTASSSSSASCLPLSPTTTPPVDGPSLSSGSSSSLQSWSQRLPSSPALLCPDSSAVPLPPPHSPPPLASTQSQPKKHDVDEGRDTLHERQGDDALRSDNAWERPETSSCQVHVPGEGSGSPEQHPSGTVRVPDAVGPVRESTGAVFSRRNGTPGSAALGGTAGGGGGAERESEEEERKERRSREQR